MKKFLINLVKKVGKYQLKKLDQDLITKDKPDSSIVTEVDENSEKMLIEEILKKFPDSKIICEESGLINEDKTGLTWIIDPLDGTTNYSHRLPVFAVSVGVLEKEELISGIIYNPAMNELYFAEKNKGAFLNNNRIKVSKQDRLQGGLFGTGFYYTKDKDELVKLFNMLINVQKESLGVRRPGAAAIDMAWTACGRYDAYWEYGVQSWDISAGVLLVKEAGGCVTKIDGSKIDLFGRNILATNSILHDKLVEVLNK